MLRCSISRNALNTSSGRPPLRRSTECGPADRFATATSSDNEAIPGFTGGGDADAEGAHSTDRHQVVGGVVRQPLVQQRIVVITPAGASSSVCSSLAARNACTPTTASLPGRLSTTSGTLPSLGEPRRKKTPGHVGAAAGAERNNQTNGPERPGLPAVHHARRRGANRGEQETARQERILNMRTSDERCALRCCPDGRRSCPRVN